MVVVPVLVLRMELHVPLRQGCHAPRIYEFFPYAACDFLLERIIIDEAEAVELVRPELEVWTAVSIQVVINEVPFLVAVVVFKV